MNLTKIMENIHLANMIEWLKGANKLFRKALNDCSDPITTSECSTLHFASWYVTQILNKMLEGS